MDPCKLKSPRPLNGKLPPVVMSSFFQTDLNQIKSNSTSCTTYWNNIVLNLICLIMEISFDLDRIRFSCRAIVSSTCIMYKYTSYNLDTHVKTTLTKSQYDVAKFNFKADRMSHGLLTSDPDFHGRLADIMRGHA